MSTPTTALALVRAAAHRLADSYAAILATGAARPIAARRGFILWGSDRQHAFDGAVSLTPDAMVLVDNPVTRTAALEVTWDQVRDLLHAHVHSADRAAIVAAYGELLRLESAHRLAAERVRALISAGAHPERGPDVAINGIPAEPSHIGAALAALGRRMSADVPAGDFGSEVEGGTYYVEVVPSGMQRAREEVTAANRVLVLYRRGVVSPLVVGALSATVATR